MKRSLLSLAALSLLVVVACTGFRGDDDDAVDDDDAAVSCPAAVPCTGDYQIRDGADMDEVALCESISGLLSFSYQDWFTSIDLPCLTSVGGLLNIESNDALTDISGLSNLTTVGGDLYIHENPLLCQSLVDAFVAACPGCDVGNVFNNLDGC